MVWTLQAAGTNLQPAGREVCLKRERRDRQDGRHCKRTGAHQDQQFPNHQTVQKGQQRGEFFDFRNRFSIGTFYADVVFFFV